MLSPPPPCRRWLAFVRAHMPVVLGTVGVTALVAWVSIRPEGRRDLCHPPNPGLTKPKSLPGRPPLRNAPTDTSACD